MPLARCVGLPAVKIARGLQGQVPVSGRAIISRAGIIGVRRPLPG